MSPAEGVGLADARPRPLAPLAPPGLGPPLKREWWPGGGWEHNDPFPLLLLEMKGRPSEGPKSAKRRWRRHARQQERVREAVVLLNQFAAARNSKTSAARVAPRRWPATEVQRSVLRSVERRVAAYGNQHDDMDEKWSLMEILASVCQYDLEPRHLAAYDVEKLKVCKGDLKPQDAGGLLLPAASDSTFLKHFERDIQLTHSEIEAKVDSGAVFPEPYWGPVLSSDSGKRREFFRRVLDLGILGLRRKIKSRCGAFFKGWQRQVHL